MSVLVCDRDCPGYKRLTCRAWCVSISNAGLVAWLCGWGLAKVRRGRVGTAGNANRPCPLATSCAARLYRAALGLGHPRNLLPTAPATRHVTLALRTATIVPNGEAVPAPSTARVPSNKAPALDESRGRAGAKRLCSVALQCAANPHHF